MILVSSLSWIHEIAVPFIRDDSDTLLRAIQTGMSRHARPELLFQVWGFGTQHPADVRSSTERIFVMLQNRPSLRLLVVLLALFLTAPALISYAEPARDSGPVSVVDLFLDWLGMPRATPRLATAVQSGPDEDPNGQEALPLPTDESTTASSPPEGQGDIGADADPDG